MKNGDIVWAELPDTGDSVQSGRRPCIILGNNNGLSTCPNVNIVPLSSKISKSGKIPTHVLIGGLKKPSFALTECIMTISKKRLLSEPICSINNNEFENLVNAIAMQLGLKKQA